MVFLRREEGREAAERLRASPTPRVHREALCPPRLPTYAFMLLPLPLSTMYGVFWAFCFSWSKATVPRGVSLELIFFRSCGSRVGQHGWERASAPQLPATRPEAPPATPRAPTASSSSFFIRRSVFILPEPFPWKRWDSCRKACDGGGGQDRVGAAQAARDRGGAALGPGWGGVAGRGWEKASGPSTLWGPQQSGGDGLCRGTGAGAGARGQHTQGACGEECWRVEDKEKMGESAAPRGPPAVRVKGQASKGTLPPGLRGGPPGLPETQTPPAPSPDPGVRLCLAAPPQRPRSPPWE